MRFVARTEGALGKKGGFGWVVGFCSEFRIMCGIEWKWAVENNNVTLLVLISVLHDSKAVVLV